MVLSSPAPSPAHRLVALCYGAACHGLFVAAILSAMLAMYSGMLRPGLLHWPFPLAVLWDSLLLLQFPLLHSFFLSKSGTRVLTSLAPHNLASDLSTTLFTIVASAQMLLLYTAWSPIGPVLWQATGGIKIGLTLAYLGAWLFLGRAMSDSGLSTQTGFLGWSAVYRGDKPRYPDMPDRGLFHHTRHPIYLAFASIVWLVPIWTPDQLALALWFTLYCLLGPLHKERRFQKRYGQRFADYREQVPYFLPTGRRESR